LKKCAITGGSRGLAQAWVQHFGNKQDWQIQAFAQSTGYDLHKDLERVINQSESSDLFINNAHDQQLQLKLLNHLHTSVKRMIVCGSVAADDLAAHPDEPQYGQNKRDLEWRTSHLIHNSPCDILYLKLSGTAYHNSKLIMHITDLWLNEGGFNQVHFDK